MHTFSLICAVLTGLLGVFALWKELTMRRNGVYTTGVVIDVKREAKVGDEVNSGGVTYRPIVRFATNDGQEIIWKSTQTSSSWGNTLGNQMRIIYDPRNPQRVILNRLGTNLAGIALCFLLCAICMVFFLK